MFYALDLVLDSSDRDNGNFSKFFFFLIFVTQDFTNKHEKQKGEIMIFKSTCSYYEESRILLLVFKFMQKCT